MSISCNAVRDVFVLYEDGALSPETEREVKCHLSKCRACRGYYDDMRPGYEKSSGNKVSNRPVTPPENLSFQVVAKKLHKNKVKKEIISNAAWGMVALCGVLVTVAAYKSHIKAILGKK